MEVWWIKLISPVLGGEGQDRNGGEEILWGVLFCFPMCNPAEFEPFKSDACMTDLKIKTQPCEFGDLYDSL